MTPRPTAARGLAALLALALAACTLPAPTKAPKSGASVTPRSRVTSPRPGAAGTAAKLAKPQAGTTALRGRVTLEAAYALARGGTLLPRTGEQGAAVAAAGLRLDAASGRLLSDQGGLLVSDAGGNVVAPGGAGLAPDLGDGTLLAGGALISDAAGGLISDAAGSLVGNNAGGLVANNAGAAVARFGLTQADRPAAGTELPVAGMLVSVVSLTDRSYLPLGQDAAGKPVYAVYSNVAGEFEVHVPDDAPANLLVVASAAGERDRRLSLNVVVTDRAGAAQVDELGRLVTRYVRRAFTGRLAAMLRDPALAKTATVVEPSLTDRSRGELLTFIDAIADLAREAGLPADADDARLFGASQRIVDLLLADIDLATVRIDAADVSRWNGREPLPVLAGYRKSLGDILTGAAAKLRTDPAFFTQDFLANVVNAPRGDGEQGAPIGDWTGAIRTPGDVGEFLLVEYFAAVRFNVAAPFRRLSATLYGALEPTASADANVAKAYDAEDLLYGAGMQATVSLTRRFMATPALAAEARKIFAAP